MHQSKHSPYVVNLAWGGALGCKRVSIEIVQALGNRLASRRWCIVSTLTLPGRHLGGIASLLDVIAKRVLQIAWQLWASTYHNTTLML